MSADNGIHIRKVIVDGDDRYEVRYYNASLEYDTVDEMTLLTTETTLEEAIVYGQNEGTEYGLSFSGLKPE